MSERPYARIAAELRRRIAAGELGPGDRLPSTRELAAEFGVAIATATRALAVLKEAGVTRPVRGVGTVVSPRPAPVARPARAVPAAPSPPTGLTRSRIVSTAIAIADAEGLDGVSMRRLAAELDASPMSLYRHVATKEELLHHMMDAVFRAFWREPDDAPDGWRDRVEYANHLLWAAFRRHPWVAPAMSVTRPQPIPAGIGYSEWTLTALSGTGLERESLMDVYITLFMYVRGTAINIESENAAAATSGLTPDEWLETQYTGVSALVATGRYPTFAKMLETPYDLNLDRVFRKGLTLLLDGLETRLAREHT